MGGVDLAADECRADGRPALAAVLGGRGRGPVPDRVAVPRHRNKVPRRGELAALYARVMEWYLRHLRGLSADDNLRRWVFRTLDIGSDKVSALHEAARRGDLTRHSGLAPLLTHPGCWGHQRQKCGPSCGIGKCQGADLPRGAKQAPRPSWTCDVYPLRSRNSRNSRMWRRDHLMRRARDREAALEARVLPERARKISLRDAWKPQGLRLPPSGSFFEKD